MTQPTPPAAPLRPAQSTQSRYPWRAVLRTVVAMAIGAASLLPEVVTATHLPTAGAVGQVIAVSAVVTKVLALPGVETWLQAWAPWLAPQPPTP